MPSVKLSDKKRENIINAVLNDKLSHVEVAKKYDVSPQYVGQLVKEADKELTEGKAVRKTAPASIQMRGPKLSSKAPNPSLELWLCELDLYPAKATVSNPNCYNRFYRDKKTETNHFFCSEECFRIWKAGYKPDMKEERYVRLYNHILECSEVVYGDSDIEKRKDWIEDSREDFSSDLIED